MEAASAGFPEAELIVAHGPYLSVPGRDDTPEAFALQAGGWEGQELRGPFFTGLAEGAGPDQVVVDGGELYALRTDVEFEASRAHRAEVMPGHIPWAVDEALLADWDARIDQSHTVHTDEFPVGYEQTPESFRGAMTAALEHSDRYAIVYAETQTHDWLTEANAPRPWIEALERAQRDAAAAAAEALDPVEAQAGRPSEWFHARPGRALTVSGFDVDGGGWNGRGERMRDTLVFAGEGRRASTADEFEALAAWLAEDGLARTRAEVDGADLALVGPRATAVLEDVVGGDGLTEAGLLGAGAVLA